MGCAPSLYCESCNKQPNLQILLNKGVSVHHLQNIFMEEVLKNPSLSRESKIYEIENLNSKECGVIRSKGLDVVCPIDGLVGASYVHSLSGEDNVGDADFMLSYSWGYTIGSIIDTLVDFCETNNLDTKRTYIWICCLCVNQHRVVENKKNEETSSTTTNDDDAEINFEEVFRERVVGIGKVLAMMAPWSQPLYLTRIWCIFEAFTATIEQSVELTIVMPPNERNDLETALIDNQGKGIDVLYEALSNTMVQNAVASEENDRIRILALVEQGPGYVDLNNQVNKLLRQWVASSIDKIITQRTEQERNGEISRLEYASFLDSVGNIYWKSGELERSLDICQKALSIREDEHEGDDHHLDLAKSYHILGILYSELGDYDKSLSEHLKALAIREKQEPKSLDTASTYSGIGYVKQMQGAFQEGLEAHQKALSIRRKVLGFNHVDVAQSLNNVGALQYDIFNFDEALDHYNKAMKIFKSLYGDTQHPDIARAYNNLGRVYVAQDQTGKGLSEYSKVLEIYKSILPSNHPSIAVVHFDIGLVHMEERNYDDALRSFEDALKIREETLSSEHPETQECYEMIKNAKQMMNSIVEIDDDDESFNGPFAFRRQTSVMMMPF